MKIFKNLKESYATKEIYECKECGLKFRNKISLREHEKEHKLWKRKQ